MENNMLVEKLIERANVSYEDARFALQETNWNILDAMIYLENSGKVKAPDVGIYFTNNPINKNNLLSEEVQRKYWEGYNQGSEKEYGGHNHKNPFEVVCEFIERCNNVFIEIRRGGKILTRLSLTVVILLLFFCFWVVVPAVIIAIFFDVQFSLYGEDIKGKKNI